MLFTSLIKNTSCLCKSDKGFISLFMKYPHFSLNTKRGSRDMKAKFSCAYHSFRFNLYLFQRPNRFRLATFELLDHAYLSISKGSSSLLPFLPDTPLRFPKYLSSKPFTLSRLLSLSVRKASISVSLSL